MSEHIEFNKSYSKERCSIFNEWTSFELFTNEIIKQTISEAIFAVLNFWVEFSLFWSIIYVLLCSIIQLMPMPEARLK